MRRIQISQALAALPSYNPLSTNYEPPQPFVAPSPNADGDAEEDAPGRREIHVLENGVNENVRRFNELKAKADILQSDLDAGTVRVSLLFPSPDCLPLMSSRWGFL